MHNSWDTYLVFIAGICEKHVAILIMTVTIEVSRGSNSTEKKKRGQSAHGQKKKVAVSAWAAGAWLGA